jgi:hypothetical protein
VEDSCEYCNEHSSSINCWEVLEWLHKCWPLSSIELFLVPSPLLLRLLNGLLHQPRMMTDDNDECEEVGGMRIGRANRNNRRKPVPVPFCLP